MLDRTLQKRTIESSTLLRDSEVFRRCRRLLCGWWPEQAAVPVMGTVLFDQHNHSGTFLPTRSELGDVTLWQHDLLSFFVLCAAMDRKQLERRRSNGQEHAHMLHRAPGNRDFWCPQVPASWPFTEAAFESIRTTHQCHSSRLKHIKTTHQRHSCMAVRQGLQQLVQRGVAPVLRYLQGILPLLWRGKHRRVLATQQLSTHFEALPLPLLWRRKKQEGSRDSGALHS